MANLLYPILLGCNSRKNAEKILLLHPSAVEKEENKEIISNWKLK